MPNRKMPFQDYSYYHVFNRGVEKRIIFEDRRDYKTFIDILSYYLTFSKKSFENVLVRTGEKNLGLFQDEISLLAYCLMPNHFHLLIHQKSSNSLSNFMSRICTTYAMYFNKKYTRVGSLYQGRFKANHVDTDEYLIHVSKYIHRNPQNFTRSGLVNYPWSSYGRYVGINDDQTRTPLPVRRGEILNFFPSENQNVLYKDFVEDEHQEEWLITELSNLI